MIHRYAAPLAIIGGALLAVFAVVLLAELAVVTRADAAAKPPIPSCASIQPHYEASR